MMIHLLLAFVACYFLTLDLVIFELISFYFLFLFNRLLYTWILNCYYISVIMMIFVMIINFFLLQFLSIMGVVVFFAVMGGSIATMKKIRSASETFIREDLE